MTETSQSRTPPRFIPLPERSLLVVAGPDAAHFLHNLVTAGIETLAPGMMRPAALLTPQGKVIVEMLIANAGEPDEPDGLFLIDVAQPFAEDLLARLVQYKLRAEVTLGHAPAGTGVAVMLDQPDFASEEIYVFDDPRHAGLGKRLVGPMEQLHRIGSDYGAETAAFYHHRRVRLGIPEIGKDYAPQSTFPHEILLDQLGGVDFRKGCYVGQEVVSRMEHRGTARTRALPVRFEGGFGVVGGSGILAGERALGSVGESFGDHAIGLVRLDRLAEAIAAGETIRAGGAPIVIEQPDFVRFAVPQANAGN
jgi:folate-binding protein YgfZ